MRALAVCSVVGLLLPELAVPEHLDPAWKTVRVHWSDFSPESRPDKRVHFGLGSESRAKSIEIHRLSRTFQALKSISSDQVIEIKEPARGARRR